MGGIALKEQKFNSFQSGNEVYNIESSSLYEEPAMR